MAGLLRIEKVLDLNDERAQRERHDARLDSRSGQVLYIMYVTNVDGRPYPLPTFHQ